MKPVYTVGMQNHPIFTFDLDGVITDPADSSVDERTIAHIHNLLESGLLVAVNTGRSYVWVKQHLLQRLEAMGGLSAFNRVFIVCEKGGESITWTGNSFEVQPSRFALEADVHHQCHQLFESHASKLQTMFWDDTKQTMATIEKHPHADLQHFKDEQVFLAKGLRDLLANHEEVKVDATTIAIDVESILAGKHAGAELIYEWAVNHTGDPTAPFISLGDSRSDYEMARYFAQQGNDSTFVFVGAKSDAFDEDPRVTLIRTEATYAAGTNEYFDKRTIA